MLVLVVMIRSRYTSLLFPTSIENKSTFEDSFYFLDFNKTTKEAMTNIKASKELLQILEAMPIRLQKT